VDDPGRVQVALRTERGVVPLLAPDGRPQSVPISDALSADSSSPTVAREQYRIALNFGARDVVLVDENGAFPSTPSADGISHEGGFFYANYDVSAEHAFEPGRAPPGGIPIQLSTPIDNVKSARYTREPRKWPAYVGMPVGGTFVLIGSALIASSPNFNDESAAKTVGVVCVLGGLIGFGMGLYALLDKSKVVELVPARP